jgi:hypothetical protein
LNFAGSLPGLAEIATVTKQLNPAKTTSVKNCAGRYSMSMESTTMRNSIFVIKPYKFCGMWVFDDPAVGLVREPFVGGADTMIDVATAHIPNAAQAFVAIFSASYFPDAQIVLDWVREEGGGNVYRWPEKNMEGWLCPALLRYFSEAPEKLYVQVKAAG